MQRADEWNYYRFFKEVEKYLTVPLLVVPGNHEVKGNRELYKSALGKWYYSFKIGGTAFLVLSCTSSDGIDFEQRKWLEKKLLEYKDLKYRFVFMHYPLFDPDENYYSHSLSEKAAKDLLAIFEKNHITYIFAGHIHGYFRGNWDGIPFIISGGGGARLMGYDPKHYFFHYIKVTVDGSRLKIKVCKVPTSE